MFHLGSLAVWHHTPPQPPRGRVLLIHGIGEHSLRHQHTIDFLLKENLEVVRFDLRGAGQSGGRRQYIDHFSDYVEDVNSVFNWINRSLPPLPHFVLGHSLGGAIAIYFAAARGNELQGLILSAPAFHLGRAISKLKVAIGKTLARALPTLRLPSSNSMDQVSRDPAVVEAYAKDPLSCHFNTLQQGKEVIAAMQKIPEQLGYIVCPTVLFHGSADQIIPLEGSYSILRKLPAESKILHILPGGYHEPHNDLEKEAYFGLLATWLNRRLDGIPRSTV